MKSQSLTPMPTPQCPRCGYDQSGETARWSEQCPLEGVCSECGLALVWRDILNPKYQFQLHAFEHVKTKKWAAFWRTFRRVLRPWKFWSWIQMHHEVVWARVLFFVPATGAILTLFGSALIALIVWIDWFFMSSFVRWGPLPERIVEEIVPLLAWPLAVVESIAGLPLRRRTFDVDFGPLGFLAVAFAIIPATFLVMPFTLRRAKVRQGHLWRIALYSWAGFSLVPVATRAATWMWAMAYDLDSYETTGVNAMCMIIATALWALCFFGFALSRYLKLPRPWFTVVVMHMLAMVLALALAFLAGHGVSIANFLDRIAR